MSQKQTSLCAKELRGLFTNATKETGWKAPEEFPGSIEGPFFPDPKNIFKAFELVAPDEVKYVILGQDPYPRSKKGEPDSPIATGIAFGVSPIDICECKIHSSCAIYKVLAGIYGSSPKKADRMARYDCSDLVQWARRHKVLMLNVALTVPPGKPGAHLGLWTPFTKAILKQVRRNSDKPRFISWGAPAAEIATDLNPLLVAHPSSRKGGFASFWNTPDGQALRDCPRVG